jgi:hypothetical protein
LICICLRKSKITFFGLLFALRWSLQQSPLWTLQSLLVLQSSPEKMKNNFQIFSEQKKYLLFRALPFFLPPFLHSIFDLCCKEAIVFLFLVFKLPFVPSNKIYEYRHFHNSGLVFWCFEFWVLFLRFRPTLENWILGKTHNDDIFC